jgi:hypothetical protein
MSLDYRKIYKKYYGSIPIDTEGRRYEIHHIDGDRENNNIENLIALSIREHYDIHYSQGDSGACLRIGAKMNLSSEELSDIAKKHQRSRVENGTHHFLGPSVNQKRIDDGTHNLLGSDHNRKLIDAGTHHFLNEDWQKDKARKSIESETHNFLKRVDGTSVASDRVKTGTNPFCGTENVKKQLINGEHPSQIKTSCIYCRKTMGRGQFSRYHGDRCKKKEMISV